MELNTPLGRGKRVVYPTKTSINLVTCNAASTNTPRTLVLFALVMVAVLLFAKFGVIDVLGIASASTSKVTAAQTQLTQLQAANDNYDELQERYASYTVNSMSSEERDLADRKAILELLQGSVANEADLQSVSISGNVVSLQFVNTSLEAVSRVVSSLETNSLVANVAMSTVKTNKNDDVVSTITVELNPASATADEESEA